MSDYLTPYLDQKTTAKPTHISPIFIKIKGYSVPPSGWEASKLNYTTTQLSDLQEAGGPRWREAALPYLLLKRVTPRLQESCIFSVVRKRA